MNISYQIQIKPRNWVGSDSTITYPITENDFKKFANLISAINKNSGNNTWNWFGKGNGLPEIWDGTRYSIDFWRICNMMKENFNYTVEDINLIKEFYIRFTPRGCDGIRYIKIFKVEEITSY